MAFLHTGASNICELQHTHLTAFSKYSKASAYFAYFSKACPTLLKSLAFLVFTFNADLKMLYSDSLKVEKNKKINMDDIKITVFFLVETY